MFTDIEGSTKNWDKYQDTFRLALEDHNALMRKAIRVHNGYEVKTIGDSFMVAFADPVEALCCAIDMQRSIENGDFEAVGGMRVRIGLHSGDLKPYDGDYFGPVVNHAARIESTAHGGQTVVSEEVASAVASRPEGLTLSDDGLHQLKDLGAPIRLFLATAEDLPQRDYPPLRSLALVAHNFPAQVTSFIGREADTEALMELLQGKTRLITILGPGGTGKTRLSMQVAAEAVQDYVDGIWLVELANISDAREVPSAIALALKIPLAPNKPVPDQVFEYLAEKKCLLVLDNFEHVIEGATFVNTLLKRCRHLVCLVTSQHLLQIAGEVEYLLPPLSLPPPHASLAEALRYPSVQLFVERAQAARAQFALTEETLPAVVELCRHLDGSPLALELTAALVRGMTPAQILPRLKDRFKLLASTRRDLDPRHRSLRGALDWSYELLTEEERSLFAEVSVFVGGFYMEDLEAVSESPDALFLAFALRDKSLLKTDDSGDETRYYLLESIRIYAASKLEESGETHRLRERHALRYLETAKTLGDQLHSSGEAMQRMILEIDNLRAGFDWAIEQQSAAHAATYGRPLTRFFQARGLYDEGDRRLAQAEAVCRAALDERALAQILLLRGNICGIRADYENADRFWSESYAIYRQLNDSARMLVVLSNLGNIAWHLSDYEIARQRWEEALEIARATNQPEYEAGLLSHLGCLATDQGRFKEAAVQLNQSLAMHEKMGDQHRIAFALHHKASLLSAQRDFPSALQLLEESRQLFERIGYQWGIAYASAETAQVLVDVGKPEAASDYINAALEFASRTGDKRCELMALAIQALIFSAQGNRSEAMERLRNSARIAFELKDRRQLAMILRNYGNFLGTEGAIDEAILFLSGAQREYEIRGLHEVEATRGDLAQLLGNDGNTQAVVNAWEIPSLETLYTRMMAASG